MIPKEVLEQARNVDLKTFCDVHGIDLKQEDKHGNYRYEGFGGLIIKENYFVHFSDSNKGGNPIDFVMIVKDCDFSTAVELLTGVKTSITINQKPNKTNVALTLPVPNEDNKRAIAYLSKKRKIDYQIIKEFINKGLLYQDKNNNVTFVWKDFNGQIVGANQRGIIDTKDFKRNLPGSNFDVGFTYQIGIPQQLLVFESVIDLLSVLTLKKINKQKFCNLLLIATCNLNVRPIINSINHFKSIEKVFICYDNDKPAREFIESLELEKPFVYYHPTHSKDWNEHLQQLLN